MKAMVIALAVRLAVAPEALGGAGEEAVAMVVALSVVASA